MAKKTKLGRKFGRNKSFCSQYASERRHEKSHYLRIVKHLASHLTDEAARASAKFYELSVPESFRRRHPIPF